MGKIVVLEAGVGPICDAGGAPHLAEAYYTAQDIDA